jgi:hypothetical protein
MVGKGLTNLSIIKDMFTILMEHLGQSFIEMGRYSSTIGRELRSWEIPGWTSVCGLKFDQLILPLLKVGGFIVLT